MKNKLLTLCIKLQDLQNREDGQDLVEYSLVVALISLGATASMQSLAGGINTAFLGLSTTLGTYVT
jgi:pilus assembly protein Flp/PilA